MTTPRTGAQHAPAVLGTARAGTPVRAALRSLAAWLLDARAIPFALAAVTFLVFSPGLRNGFVQWDDYVNLIENPTLPWARVERRFAGCSPAR